MSAVLSSVFGAGVQFFDNQGIPLSGGFLYSYLGGTTTLQPTWTSSSQTVQNANPIVLNSAGRITTEIWISNGVACKFVVTDSDGNVLGTWDNIPGVNQTTVALTEWIPGFTVSYASPTSFTVSGNTVDTYQVNRRIKYSLTGGTYYGTVTVSTYDGIGTTTVTFLPDSTSMDSSVTTVDYGFMSATNPAVPAIFLTSSNPAITGSLGVTGGTRTSNIPVLNETQTWNNAGVTFTGELLNVTDTASAAGSLLKDMQVGGTSKWNVDKSGNVTQTGALNKVTVTPPAAGATLTIANGKTFTANNTVTIAGTDGSTLDIANGGTLGSAAFTGTGAYLPIGGTATSASNLAGGVAGAVSWQSAAGVTAFTTAGTSSQVLISNGTSAPSWASQSVLSVAFAVLAGTASNAGTSAFATLAGTASNAGTSAYATLAGTSSNAGTAAFATLAGTSSNAGTSAYAGTSGFATLAGTSSNAGTSAYALQAGTAAYATLAGTASNAGTSAFATLAGTSSNAGTSAFATNLLGGVAGGVVYQAGLGTSAITTAGTSGQYLQSNGTGAPSWATPSITAAASLLGGSPGVIPYQIGTDTTGFTTAGTAGQFLQSNGTAAPSWATPTSGGGGAPTSVVVQLNRFFGA